MFQQAVNTADQGGAIPIIYGDCMVGSQVISAGMLPYDFGSNAPAPGVGYSLWGDWRIPG